MDYLVFLNQMKRDEKKLGQAKTAKKYGITQGLVSLILNGKRSGFRVWQKLHGPEVKK